MKRVFEPKLSIDIDVKKFFKDPKFLEYYERFIPLYSELDRLYKSYKEGNKAVDPIKEFERLKSQLEALEAEYGENGTIKEFKEIYTECSKAGKTLDLTGQIKIEYERIKGIEVVNPPVDIILYLQKLRSLSAKKEFLSVLKISEKPDHKLYAEELKLLQEIYGIYSAVRQPQAHQIYKDRLKERLDIKIETIINVLALDPVSITLDSPYSAEHMRVIGDKLLKFELGDSYKYIEKITLSQIDKDFIESMKRDAANVPVFASLYTDGYWVALGMVSVNDPVSSQGEERKEPSDGQAQEPQITVEYQEEAAAASSSSQDVRKSGQKIKILYKDSFGKWGDAFKDTLQKEFAKLGEVFTDDNFVVNATRENEKGYNSGSLALQNLAQMARFLKEGGGVDNLVSGFKETKFTSSEACSLIRKKHNAIFNDSKKEEARESAKLTSYVKDQLSSIGIDLSFRAKELLDTIDMAIKLNPKNIEAQKTKAVLLQKLSDKYEKEGNLAKAFEYIEKSLITYEDTGEILAKKGDLKKRLGVKEEGGAKTTKDRLEEIKKDGIDESNLAFFTTKLPEIQSLIPGYENWTKDQIRQWSDQVKANPQRDIAEYIAVIDRANYIDTMERFGGHGHHLRDTQILAVLSFFNVAGNGRLDQIKTGEGKSTIVSVLAIIKVLQGQKVDVLTSSSVLAKRDAEEKQGLYDLFGLTVTNNEIDPNYTQGSKECYKADILYGSISNFQFDLLKHEHQGLDTRGSKGQERKFGVVIIDEVDSMLVDNGGHLAKLSGPLPGMEYLESILLYIWGEVNALAPFLMLISGLIGKPLHEIEKYEEYKAEVIKKVKKKIAESFVPEHLKAYANDDSQVQKWVNHAFSAAALYQQDREYTVKLKDGEEVISPIDYSNTGSIQTGTIWSDGLHQFLQIKHGLRITPESCNTSYISNVGYIKKYIKAGQPSIFGLTGTLGGEKEKILLNKSYEGLDFISIPTYKAKKFEEKPGVLQKQKEEWLGSITTSAILEAASRSVLIICETIQDATTITQLLESKIQGGDIKLRSYLEESHSSVTEEKVNKGDIIIATNLAGRGTDIKTSSEVEANGGLHVIITFLPCNQRVEDQAFGRTSRQGNNGTGQLIIKENTYIKSLKKLFDEVREEEKQDLKPQITFAVFKSIRDIFEESRIEKVTGQKLESINLGDELFSSFSQMCKELKESNEQIYWMHFTIRAIEERWGLWLKQRDISNKLIDQATRTSILAEFDIFKSEIMSLFVRGNDEAASLEVIRNPYYLVTIGEICFKFRDFHIAKEALQKAIALDPSSEVAASAHYLLAFTEIQAAKAAENVIANAAKALVPIASFLDPKSAASREGSIEKAQHNLSKALTGVESVISVYRGMLEQYNALPKDYGAKINLATHLVSKICLLNMYKVYIKLNQENITKSSDVKKVYITVKKVIPFSHDVIKFGDEPEQQKQAQELKDRIKNQDIKEISSIGFRSIFYVDHIKDIPPEVVTIANTEIIAGIAALGLSTTPFVGPILERLGSFLLSDGINGIADALVKCFNETEQPFDGEEVAKRKIKSLVVSLAVAGLGALAQSSGVLKDSINLCEKISKTLNDTSGLAGEICHIIAQGFDAISHHLTTILEGLQTAQALDIGQMVIDQILDRALEAVLTELKLGDIKKLIDVARSCDEINVANVAKLANAIPNTDIKWLNQVKSFTSVITRLEEGIRHENFNEIISAFENTGIKELDDAMKAVQKVTTVYTKLQAGIKDEDFGQILGTISNTGIKQIDDVVGAVRQVHQVCDGIQRGIKSEDLGQMLGAVSNTGIREIDDVVGAVQKVTTIHTKLQAGVKGEDFGQILGAISNTGIKEIDDLVITVRQMCEMGDSLGQNNVNESIVPGGVEGAFVAVLGNGADSVLQEMILLRDIAVIHTGEAAAAASAHD